MTSASFEFEAAVRRPGVSRNADSAPRPAVVVAPADGPGRRILNFAVAAVGVVLAAPAMFVIAVAIKLTSPGAVIYAQQRVGIDRRNDQDAGNHRRRRDLGGRPFTIYKFRTMRVSATSGDAQVWASPDDPRVTAVGRFLRKYRLDELPQLFNVLRGDMNVVGPRPEQPRIFSDLRGRITHYGARQRVLPGITGWAQISHHYDASLEDVHRKVAFDLEYIARCSALHDFMIMLKTVPVMVLKRGAW